MKEVIIGVSLVLTLCLCLVACGGNSQGSEEQYIATEDESEEDGDDESVLPPDASDEEVLDELEDDINVITDDDYVETVAAMIRDVCDFAGNLYQIEGTYTTKDGIPYLTRTLVNGDEKTQLELPLEYIMEDIDDGSWVKVMGVPDVDKIGDKEGTVLKVAVVEVIDEPGHTELEWDGSVPLR